MKVSPSETAVPPGGKFAPVSTMADERLNEHTAMLLRLTGAEVGGISIVYRDQIWRLSYIGPFEQIVARSGAFCPSALAAGGDWFEIEDAAADPRYRDHPLVEEGAGYRHYVAVPIFADCIQLRGTVWAMWHAPGRLSPERRNSLRMVAQLAAATLQLRYCDEVTKIVNRTFFVHSLQGMIEEGSYSLTVGYINLRSFSWLNNAYGQEVGDEFLSILSRRLVEWGGEGSLVGHLGGDRFAFTLAGSPEECGDRLRRLPYVIEEPLRLASGQKHRTRARVGLRSIACGAAPHAAVVLQQAAAAAAGSDNGSARHYGEDGPHVESLLRMGLYELLCGKSGHGHLEVVYEPQFDLACCRLVGLEALVRWRHPVVGLLTPGHFVTLAEQIGKIFAMDMLVLRQVCEDLSAWRRAGLAEVPVALNFARDSLVEESMPRLMAEELDLYGLEGRHFECEITESQCGNAEVLQDRLAALRALGVRVAIDDFGTGYSNLETIRRLPFDKLKIDRQFVDGVADDVRLAGLVNLVVSVAGLFGADVLCEGVERERDLMWLQSHGVSRFQGWYFSKPMSAGLAAEALRKLSARGAFRRHDELRAQLQILQCGQASALRAASGS